MTADPQNALAALLIPTAAALISMGLIVALQPLLQRYALPRPNVRSPHTIPTPQGGGIAVMSATAIAAMSVELLAPTSAGHATSIVLTAACCLAVLGVVDYLKPIPVTPRLTLQLAIVALLLIALPSQTRILEAVPV